MTDQPFFSPLAAFSIAWCAELEQLVYAKDVPLLRELHAPKSLSFSCFLCQKTLFFHGYEDVEKTLVAGFVQEENSVCDARGEKGLMNEHENCLESLTTTHDIFLYEAFERAFLLVEAHQKATRKALCTLQQAFFHLREAVFSDSTVTLDSSDLLPAELLKKIELSLKDVMSGHDFCNRDLAYVHSAYMTLREITKGT